MNDFNKRLAVLLMRLYLGGIFLVAGSGKIFGQGIGNFAQYIQGTFSSTFLPSFMLTILGYSLPLLELAVGVLLIIGLFRTFSFALTGLLCILLSQGQFMIKEYATASNNGIYFIVAIAGLILLDRSILALDSLFETRL